METAPIRPNIERNPIREALLGLTATNQHLCLFDYGDIVVLRDYQHRNNVRLLSGGVADENLSMALLVGKGLLTSAVLGHQCIPGSHLILRTLQELSVGEFNCGIVVIMNSSNDKFNFGLAAERANSDCGTRVRFLSLDDCRGSLDPHYSCGVVILIKILGAMSELGMTIDDICKVHRKIAPVIRSVGMNFFLPEAVANERFEIETNWDFCDLIYKKSKETLDLHPSVPVIILVNTPRCISRIDEFDLVKLIVDKVQNMGVCIIRLYLGNFVAVPHNMASMSIMKVTESQIVEYLDYGCQSSSWQSLPQFLSKVSTDNVINSMLVKTGMLPVLPKGAKLDSTQTKVFVTALRFACDALISCEKQLNLMDDYEAGDVGTRLRQVCTEINNRLAAPDNVFIKDNPYCVFKKIGFLAESIANGTMGTIYGIFFENAAEYFGKMPENADVTPVMWTRALKIATKALKRYCTESAVVKTMYLPLSVCQKIVKNEITGRDSVLEVFGFGVAAAEQAAMETRQNKTFPDAAAHAVGIWLRAAYEAVKVANPPEIKATD